MTVIDAEGFRLNVGIILANSKGQLFWGKRIGSVNAWQFPQGGIQEGELPVEAMYRELNEELGLHSEDVLVHAQTEEWLSYRLPKQFRRRHSRPLCIGQKQKWFFLELISDDSAIQLHESKQPEFEEWRWVSYWHPLKEVIAFKKIVYRKALQEFVPFMLALKEKTNITR